MGNFNRFVEENSQNLKQDSLLVDLDAYLINGINLYHYFDEYLIVLKTKMENTSSSIDKLYIVFGIGTFTLAFIQAALVWLVYRRSSK